MGVRIRWAGHSSRRKARVTPMPKPLCFVLMPFGQKPGAGGAVIDFDAVYRDLIKPAVDAASLTPLRADEEQAGGIIHKPMFERLILCDFAAARKQEGNARVATIRAIEQQLGALDRAEAGVLVDLLLSYRAASEWKEMIRLAGAMPEPLRRSTLVQEQLAFALNRTGDDEKAEQLLLDLTRARGPSSETYGLLGRVYKDRWEAATKQGDRILARV